MGFSQYVPAKVPAEPPSLMSVPAQKARPAPVRMATQASVSSRKRSQSAFITAFWKTTLNFGDTPTSRLLVSDRCHALAQRGVL